MPKTVLRGVSSNFCPGLNRVRARFRVGGLVLLFVAVTWTSAAKAEESKRRTLSEIFMPKIAEILQLPRALPLGGVLMATGRRFVLEWRLSPHARAREAHRPSSVLRGLTLRVTSKHLRLIARF